MSRVISTMRAQANPTSASAPAPAPAPTMPIATATLVASTQGATIRVPAIAFRGPMANSSSRVAMPAFTFTPQASVPFQLASTTTTGASQRDGASMLAFPSSGAFGGLVGQPVTAFGGQEPPHTSPTQPAEIPLETSHRLSSHNSSIDAAADMVVMVTLEFKISAWSPNSASMQINETAPGQLLHESQHYKEGLNAFGIAYDANGNRKDMSQVNDLIVGISRKHGLPDFAIDFIYRLMHNKHTLCLGYHPNMLKVLQELQYNACIYAVSSMVTRFVWKARSGKTSENLMKILNDEDARNIFHYLSAKKSLTRAEIAILHKVQDRIVVLKIGDDVVDEDLAPFKYLRYLDLGTNTRINNHTIRNMESLEYLFANTQICTTALQTMPKIKKIVVKGVHMTVNRRKDAARNQEFVSTYDREQDLPSAKRVKTYAS